MQDVWTLFAAVATHKFVISFCMGIELVSVGTPLGSIHILRPQLEGGVGSGLLTAFLLLPWAIKPV